MATPNYRKMLQPMHRAHIRGVPPVTIHSKILHLFNFEPDPKHCNEAPQTQIKQTLRTQNSTTKIGSTSNHCKQITQRKKILWFTEPIYYRWGNKKKELRIKIE